MTTVEFMFRRFLCNIGRVPNYLWLDRNIDFLMNRDSASPFRFVWSFVFMLDLGSQLGNVSRVGNKPRVVKTLIYLGFGVSINLDPRRRYTTFVHFHNEDILTRFDALMP